MGILQPRPTPKKAYADSDRFEEDGRRLVSILTIVASVIVMLALAWPF